MENTKTGVALTEEKAEELEIISELKAEEENEKKDKPEEEVTEIEILEKTRNYMSMTFFLRFSYDKKFIKVSDVASKKQKCALTDLSEDVNFERKDTSSSEIERNVLKAALYERNLEIKKNVKHDGGIFEMTSTLVIAYLSKGERMGKKFKRVTKIKKLTKAKKKKKLKNRKKQYLCFEEIGTDEEIKKILDFLGVPNNPREFELQKAFIRGKFLTVLKSSPFIEEARTSGVSW